MADEIEDIDKGTVDDHARSAVSTGLDDAIAAESKLGEGIPDDKSEIEDEKPDPNSEEQVEETPEQKAERERIEAEAENGKKKDDLVEETPTEKVEREKKEVADKKAAEAPKALSDEKGEIKMPDNLRPGQQANWRRLEAKAIAAESKLAEVVPAAELVPQLQAEVDRLKANPELPEETRAMVEEAEKIRGMFFLTHSEDFQQKYDGRIAAIEQGVYDLFKKYKMPEATIEQIKSLGGPTKIDEKWLTDNVLSKVGVVEGERIKKSLVDVLDLQSAKTEELAKAGENAKKYLEEKEQGDTQAFEQDQTAIKSEIDAAIKQLPWAQEKQIPAGASEADKKAIAAHNTEVGKFNAHIQSYLYPKTAQVRAQVAIAAAMSLKIAADMGGLVMDRDAQVKKVKELEGQLSALKSKGTIPTTKVRAPVKKIETAAPSVNEDAQTAISRGLDEALGE